MSELQKIIIRQLLPWAQHDPNAKIIVADNSLDKRLLPLGVEASPAELPGKRVPMKGGRRYNNARVVSAKWPDAGMHETENARFIFVTKGTINYQVGRNLIRCPAGNIIFIPPGTPHPGWRHVSIRARNAIPNEPAQLFFFAGYRQALQCWETTYLGETYTSNTRENYLFLDTLLIHLQESFVAELMGERNRDIINGILLAWVNSLHREVQQRRFLRPGPALTPLPILPSSSPFIGKLVEYIQGNIDHSLSLDEVSRHFHISRAQFVRRVKEQSGYTFGEILIQARVEIAKVLLQQSAWTVEEISRFVGLTSANYFQKMFTRYAGKTPTAYRKSFQQKKRPVSR